MGADHRSSNDQRGVVAVYVAILLPVLVIVVAFAVDISRWYVELQRLQKTADAAALAAAPFMPDPLTRGVDCENSSPAARAACEQVIANGYDWAATDVLPGPRRTAVAVSVENTVANGFATLINIPETTLARTATSEFTGPAPLGSPCNVHGNEPNGPGEPSQLPSPLPANCSSFPKFWSTIVGPEVYKTQGDEYAARKCGVDPYQESNCTPAGNGGSNDRFANELGDEGYVISIKVKEPITGPLRIELYDPAYVDTGSTCTELPNWTGAEAPNPFTNNASERYRNNSDPIDEANGRPSYCSGDNDNGGLRFGPERPTVTSFGMLSPTETLNPYDPVVNANNQIASCTRQFPGFSKRGGGNERWDPSSTGLSPGADATAQLSRNSALTRLFHQWVTLCEIPSPVVGDYYLRVRTNIADGFPDRVYTQQGDDPTVVTNGSNRFAVRAIPGTVSDRNAVSVSPFERMPIFANANQSDPTFNLIRVVPESAGSNIIFSFFDVGDLTGPTGGSGTLTVLPPTEATLVSGMSETPFVTATDCTKERGPIPLNPAITDTRPGECVIEGIRNTVPGTTTGWNGQFQQMTIPIPPNYSCDAEDPFGCWWRLKTEFTSTTSVTDQTTWTAVLDGDPVRLIPNPGSG